jgi:hypothetical protein
VLNEVAAATKHISRGLFENEHLSQTGERWLSSLFSSALPGFD